MAYDGRLLRLAQERYEADRSAREADLAEQREQLYARRPRLREIQDQLRRTASRVMAAALRRGEDPLPEIQRLREENLSLQAERQMLLAELGLPDNALEDKPFCPFCNDTGYRGGEMCRCLKTYYVEEQRKELSKLLDLGSRAGGSHHRQNRFFLYRPPFAYLPPRRLFSAEYPLPKVSAWEYLWGEGSTSIYRLLIFL